MKHVAIALVLFGLVGCGSQDGDDKEPPKAHSFIIKSDSVCAEDKPCIEVKGLIKAGSDLDPKLVEDFIRAQVRLMK